MNDYTIKLNNLAIKAAHGLHDIEKVREQVFEIDVEISFSKKSCADNIKNSINYESVYNVIKNIFQGKDCFDLLETLGEKTINSIYKMGNFKNVKVSIRKPEIKFDNNSNCVEVSISKNNE